MYDYAIIGGGIVGLSTATALQTSFPSAKILVVEKESDWAHHQTGHNSGVIHSGIYYKPGSLKAYLAKSGNSAMYQFCEKNEIPVERCGKVIVATKEEELPLLEGLYERGKQHSLDITMMNSTEVNKIEPYVSCLSGIHVKSTGIVDYRQVCKALAMNLQTRGADLYLDTKIKQIEKRLDYTTISSTENSFSTNYLINCAGLQSDRVAKAAKDKPAVQIVPFRGEYYEIKPERKFLVKNLIYPVPNPSFPFLGVHFTRSIDGKVEAGPNAVLSLKREGYKKTDFSPIDFVELLKYAGFWRLALKYWKLGLNETMRSFSKGRFLQSLQQMIPEIQESDIISAPSGVRAQALKPDGQLVDDFHIIWAGKTVHVCNAPSPAATASLEIGKYISKQIEKQFHAAMPLQI